MASHLLFLSPPIEVSSTQGDLLLHSLSLKDSIDDAFLKLPDPDACFCIPHKALSKPVPVWECLVAHGYST
ncbi:hypothetical protein F2Q68_00012287 [Brassica cretica]|uniref:Uncharacterized protein n=1 Tax=Brassica cretica TaxID=69181 RepID=A0A8S9KLP0_BRACR|nr:hypothetical protein F2Q68_00012287 [Brassica cretica]